MYMQFYWQHSHPMFTWESPSFKGYLNKATICQSMGKVVFQGHFCLFALINMFGLSIVFFFYYVIHCLWISINVFILNDFN